MTTYTLDAETTAALIADARQAEADFLAAIAADDAAAALRARPRIDSQPDDVEDADWWGVR